MTLSRQVRRAVFGFGMAALFAMTSPLAAASQAQAVRSTTSSSVVGTGFWEKVACIGCVAGFLVGGATTIIGVAAFIAANPEIAVACTMTCASALSD